MRRTTVSRIAAMAIAVLTGISVSGSGLAHGYAHQEAVEHEVHQHASNAESRDGMRLLSEGANSSETHVHAQLAYAVSARAHAPVPVDAGIQETIAAAIEPARVVFVPFADPPARASSPLDPAPNQSRAPPTG